MSIYLNQSTSTNRIVATRSTKGILQPGYKIKIGTQDKYFRIIKTGLKTFVDHDTFEIEETSLGIAASNSTEVLSIVQTGTPQFNVEHLIQGEDSYSYDIYFTGKHSVDVQLITAEICPGFKQVGAMTYGLDTHRVVQSGGK